MSVKPMDVALVKHGRQFFDSRGDEVFFAIATGRRPDVNDALLAMGRGSTRDAALLHAEMVWLKAYRSLQSTATFGKKTDRP